MEHDDHRRTNGTDHRARFDFVTEREKLLNNLDALRKTSKELSANTNRLRQLYQEIEFEKADLLALQVKISSVAVKYGLPPISGKSKDFKEPNA